MTEVERRENVRQFINEWQGRGHEDQDDRPFWLHLIKALFGIGVEEYRIDFQKKVKVDGSTKKIDAYIPETKVLIEQKSLNVPLDQKQHQSGDIELTPFEQALRYNNNLPYEERARWIVTSNFGEFWIYDMNKPGETPIKITIEELIDKYPILDFLFKKDVQTITEEVEVSVQAGNLVGKLYDALKKQYAEPDSEETLKSLNMLCVRLVFLLYAEDELGVLEHKSLLHEYLGQADIMSSPRVAKEALIKLFRVLNQDPNKGERDKYLEQEYPILAKFPYVNGDLFKDDNLEIPPLTKEIIEILLKDCSENFDWSKISPTIFGAVFESTLNLETRRSGGMHYTSIENIHKVIDPLFLDDLKEEFENIRSSTQKKAAKLEEFHDKLASLKFLDPACGSGNFLTETYMCLRKLENEVIKEEIASKKGAVQGQTVFGDESISPVKVNIKQFYGIEINDFAVSVARAALWIAESQMLKETMDIVHQELDFLPLTTNASIVEANALWIDWNDVLPANECNYIMGNPPFVGKKEQNKEQKKEMADVFTDNPKGAGNLDYVSCWYKKACEYIPENSGHAAFVSTNSITQGEQVFTLWNKLIFHNIIIDFAYRTFRWDSEANIKAHVHCVIIGFSKIGNTKKLFLMKKIIRVLLRQYLHIY